MTAGSPAVIRFRVRLTSRSRFSASAASAAQIVLAQARHSVGLIRGVSSHDGQPSILLNLAFSTQAAYAVPLILLAGHRASQRDRMTLEHAAAQADVEERQNEQLAVERLDGD
jgi:hypothetical protein